MARYLKFLVESRGTITCFRAKTKGLIKCMVTVQLPFAFVFAYICEKRFSHDAAQQRETMFVKSVAIVVHCIYSFYSPALKKWGLYWICPVLPLFRNSAILLFRKSVTISFPLNILRTNGQNLTKFCIRINIDKI